MELKETKHLPTSIEKDVVKPSEKNNNGERRIYDIFFQEEEDAAEPGLDIKYSNNKLDERRFGNVSTLDWLKTWRSTEIG